MRYRETLTVPILLERGGRAPLHDQIADQLAAAVRAGRLSPGTRMPSTRTLAGLLGVSRGVAATGYDILAARGVTEGRGGSGTYVLSHATPPARRTPRELPARAEAEGAGFPLAAWRAAWRQASCQVPSPAGPPPLGDPRLRAALAEHLRRTRGLTLDRHRAVVTAGAVPGLRLVLDALRATPEPPPAVPGHPPAPGHPDGVAAEEPWQAVAGAELTVPVDGEGARVAGLPACRAVVLAADGHRGPVLSARRRHALGEWSARTGGTVVEVTCDAVFRPAASRLPRLLDGPGAAVLVGDLGSALTPELRLGYAVVPAGLAERLGRALADRGEQPPHLVQRVATQLLADGTVVRQMHRRGAHNTATTA